MSFFPYKNRFSRSQRSKVMYKAVVGTAILSTSVKLKAMLHEAIFLPTCNATNVAWQVARKKFTCNTPFCNCNCCVASCKKSRTTLYFSQRCETSCLRVTSPLQLVTQFSQNGPIRAHLSLAGDFKMAAVVNNEKKLSDNKKIELLKDYKTLPLLWNQTKNCQRKLTRPTQLTTWLRNTV